jgi:hypothetical protein
MGSSGTVRPEPRPGDDHERDPQHDEADPAVGVPSRPPSAGVRLRTGPRARGRALSAVRHPARCTPARVDRLRCCRLTPVASVAARGQGPVSHVRSLWTLVAQRARGLDSEAGGEDPGSPDHPAHADGHGAGCPRSSLPPSAQSAPRSPRARALGVPVAHVRRARRGARPTPLDGPPGPTLRRWLRAGAGGGTRRRGGRRPEPGPQRRPRAAWEPASRGPARSRRRPPRW